MNKHCWSLPSTVCWASIVFSFPHVQADLTPPPLPPPPLSDFCRDYICLQTCLRRWVASAGGNWQERPRQPVALPLPDTWTSRVPTQSPRATHARTAAVLPSLTQVVASPTQHQVWSPCQPLPPANSSSQGRRSKRTLSHNGDVSTSAHMNISKLSWQPDRLTYFLFLCFFHCLHFS